MHTKLLSGSLSTELDLTPAQRRKALSGRILELTGQVKLGKGERAIRDIEKKKASKQVREGLASKQKERNQQELEEVCSWWVLFKIDINWVAGKTSRELSSNSEKSVRSIRKYFCTPEERERFKDGSGEIQ